ncbi:hypothetical protein M8C21_006712 [Ambrosia artemisiifolia]|uniref:Uncharacterized protein n=1 Tax=Ambrosia artemisiifolia TaxID=4212 RepID=A0AAD5D751_AMBAR|nr:hypothetical protein M8C21_006712 [Ambrosia artemisiifolia]
MVRYRSEKNKYRYQFFAVSGSFFYCYKDIIVQKYLGEEDCYSCTAGARECDRRRWRKDLQASRR